MMSSPEPLAWTTDPAFAVDHDGVLVEWNPAAEELFGRSTAQVLGKSCWTVLQGRDEFGNLYCVPGCPLLTMAERHQPVSRCRLVFETAAKRDEEFDVTTLLFPYGAGNGELLVHVLCSAHRCREAPGAAARGRKPKQGRGALTEREREVLGLLAEGRETGEIAELLGISPATAANHTRRLLRKLRVQNRLQAVVTGRRQGLV